MRAVLYAAAGEGPLTMHEVEERLARIEAARFRSELTRNVPTGWWPIMAAAGRNRLPRTRAPRRRPMRP